MSEKTNPADKKEFVSSAQPIEVDGGDRQEGVTISNSESVTQKVPMNVPLKYRPVHASSRPSSSASLPSQAVSMVRNEPVDLTLTNAHVLALCKVAVRGVVLIMLALFGMGTLAPHYLGVGLHRACNVAGVLHILLLSFLFFNSYKPGVCNLTRQQRIVGFIIFWFYAAITFNVTWQLPLWNVPFIRNLPLAKENLWWGIVWWSYTVSDKEYFDKTPIMISVELFWFLGNFFGIAGLWRFRNGRHSEALVLFVICGVLQCYNATFYIFMSWYSDFASVGPEFLDKVVFWGFNCLWPTLAIVAAWFSYRLLVPRLQDKKHV